MSYLETEDFYISGHYMMLTGKKAFKPFNNPQIIEPRAIYKLKVILILQ